MNTDYSFRNTVLFLVILLIIVYVVYCYQNSSNCIKETLIKERDLLANRYTKLYKLISSKENLKSRLLQISRVLGNLLVTILLLLSLGFFYFLTKYNLVPCNISGLLETWSLVGVLTAGACLLIKNKLVGLEEIFESIYESTFAYLLAHIKKRDLLLSLNKHHIELNMVDERIQEIDKQIGTETFDI